MEEIKNKVKNAKIGSIVPIVETLPYALDPVEYFAKLSDYGRKSHCVLLESADIVPKYGEKSLGSANPCLKIVGRNDDFEIIALNGLGIKFIEFDKLIWKSYLETGLINQTTTDTKCHSKI